MSDVDTPALRLEEDKIGVAANEGGSMEEEEEEEEEEAEVDDIADAMDAVVEGEGPRETACTVEWFGCRVKPPLLFVLKIWLLLLLLLLLILLLLL